MRATAICLGLAILLLANTVLAQRPKPPVYPPEVQAIIDDVDAQQEKIIAKVEEEVATLKDEKAKAVTRTRGARQSASLLQPAGEKILAVIEPQADKAESIDTLIWVVTSAVGSRASDTAASLLTKWHAMDRRTLDLAYRYKNGCLSWVQPMLEAQRNSPDLERADAARILYSLATLAQAYAEAPQTVASLSDEEREIWESIYTPEHMQSLRTVDTAKREAEAIGYLKELLEKYGQEKLAGKIDYETLVKSKLFALENLVVGKPIPELAAEDMDGVRFKLSDYRGKVVMLSFWGTWCGPCMELIPHEKEIALRMKDQPFAIIGVNSDENREKAKLDAQAAGVTWRSFWCGEKGPLGEIPTQWSIRSWPTIFLIDKQGIIRAKNPKGKSLDKLIDELVDSPN